MHCKHELTIQQQQVVEFNRGKPLTVLQTWKFGQALVTVRNRVRDLRRNNPYASKIIQGFSTNIVGTGFIAGCEDTIFLELFNKWADTRNCDANGRLSFYGIQKLVVESMIESGEVLILKQYNTKKEIPLTLKVLESDYLDHSKNDPAKNLIQGVQFDNFGSVSGYWIFQNHPVESTSQSKLVKASDVIHLYKIERPGQVRGISWLAPVVIPLKKLSDYEDATLEKALISNLFTAFIYDTQADTMTSSSSQVELQPRCHCYVTAWKTN